MQALKSRSDAHLFARTEVHKRTRSFMRLLLIVTELHLQQKQRSVGNTPQHEEQDLLCVSDLPNMRSLHVNAGNS